MGGNRKCPHSLSRSGFFQIIRGPNKMASSHSSGRYMSSEEYRLVSSQILFVSRTLWRKHPHLSTSELILHPQIEAVFQGHPAHIRDMIVPHIAPNLTPRLEMSFYLDLPSWNLEEATALWLDLNPLIVLLAKANPSSWEGAFFPTLWADFNIRLDQARRATFINDLPHQTKNDEIYVRPEDFLRWAMKEWEWPLCRDLIPLCEKYKAADDEAQLAVIKPSKVSSKKAEISSILDRLLVADPNFNRQAMPGRKVDFHELCKKLDQQRSMFYVSIATFDEYLHGLCAFKPGARQTDYYEQLLPKLG